MRRICRCSYFYNVTNDERTKYGNEYRHTYSVVDEFHKKFHDVYFMRRISLCNYFYSVTNRVMDDGSELSK